MNENVVENEVKDFQSVELMNNINDALQVDTNFESREVDLTWLDMFETAMPYIENILMNPKRFIVNEGEVVKIELARKVTSESVIHLTQHTNFIQKIEDNGDVKPSKILNINRNESLDTYENRFIYTLCQNMMSFYAQRVKEGIGNSYSKDHKSFKYHGNSKIGDRNLDINVEFISNEEKKIPNKGKGSNIPLPERLATLKLHVDGIAATELYKTLNKLHVAPVRSPIRKTNLIAKNPNFQQATILWNYIQSFDGLASNQVKEKESYLDQGLLKEKYEEIFSLAYKTSESLITNKHMTRRDLIIQSFNEILQNILEFDEDLDRKYILDIFTNRLDSKISEVNERREKICFIYQDAMLSNHNRILNLLDTLN